ncbi:bZIP transcription factor [Aspergillus alliaceus]|uniref:bZIP transcription factor n=1 Tax=Petromyces alliaceus TaxID=209559 RepID=UPI0012A3EFE8|nr:uncharacterized protein BDW43DRAFT_291573 [Aspergillus alliaceus]KAB8228376.1 hypothetical protein BDW43DRAFT_291573 [Aspergillus alliaceus]
MPSHDHRNVTTTAKSGQAASSARVRDNQRRSRARRKEYVQDLEQRLRRFESLGVKATQEVQTAARHVVAENCLLRSLLGQLGVTDKDVEDYLKSHIPHPTSSSSSSVNAEPVVVSHLAATHGNQVVKGGSLLTHQEEDSSDETGVNDSNPLPPGSVRNTPTKVDNVQAFGLTRPMVVVQTSFVDSKDQDQVSTRDTGQSMPCEAAARILAAMQGYQEERDVRFELGCHNDSDCTVRNMDLFEILDKRWD